ncbi:MAG: ornithine carbamoyltransferase [Pirellulaceae bacterium]
MVRHLLTLSEFSPAEIKRIFELSTELKSKLRQGEREPLLAGCMMALLFEKQSLRTRVSFETLMTHLGGGSQYLGADVGWGQREATCDFARVLSSFVDVIVCRAKSHQTVEELARFSSVPVVNALTDLAHPCQALADLFTLQELCGDLKDRKLAYIGDGNNVARSLAVCCGKLGVHLSIASPAGYELGEAFLKRLRQEIPGVRIEQTNDPATTVNDADAVYTDVWTSMGQEAERDERVKRFAGFQVNAALMKKAPPGAYFLHCLPAHRGEEVTDDVMDAPTSAVIQQAENRLHAQKGLIVWLLKEATAGSEKAKGKR